MSLILAIEPDRRQAAKVYALADTLHVELIHAETTETALAALGGRVPDLVLTSQLLSPKDEAALADRLRELDAAGSHVPTLVIPVLRGDDGERRKKGGRLLGRLRRNKDDEKTTEECDPAVFAAEITGYLERSAADRAALAQAQADLEAAWAADPLPASVGTGVDVHPDMVIDDPEALFGEFAAIPIRRPAAENGSPAADPPDDPPTTVDTIADTPAETTATAGTPDPPAADLDTDVQSFAAADAAPPEPLFDGALAEPEPGEHADGAPAAGPAGTAEDDWEEIALDAGEPPLDAGEAVDAKPSEHHVDLPEESLDLVEFVRELETVKSSANAQPMIPVVDLSHVLAGDIELPEPEVVPETQLLQEERATFDAEVAAAFAAEPEIVVEAEPELADEPVVTHHPLPPPEPSAPGEPAWPTPPSWAAPPAEPEPEPAPQRVWPEFPDLKMPVWQPPADPAPAPERWRAALESLPAPAPLSAPTADVSVVREAGPRPGWHDMLSAIQRDIDRRKKDDEPPPAAKPKADFSAEPLVFPKRTTVAANLMANIEPSRAFKQPVEAAAPAPDLQAPAAALKKLLETVVVPKADAVAGEAAMADSVGSEAAALQAALSGITAADVAPLERLEPSVDLTANPVWAGDPSLVESLGTAVEESVLSPDSMSPEQAAPELQTVDLSWLSAPAADTAGAPEPSQSAAAVDAPAEPPDAGVEFAPPADMSLEELELATRPDSTAVACDLPPVLAEAHGATPPPASVDDTPVADTPVADTPVPDEWRAQRAPKGKKKRKHAHAEPQRQPQAVGAGAVDADFGFFDPHKHGFLPLLARLDQISRGGLPLR